jgi:hypothetical protein
MRCRTCAHYVTGHPGGDGNCTSRKFVKSYHASFKPEEEPYEYKERVDLDGAILETDVGWGIIVGPDFGCVHHTGLGTRSPDWLEGYGVGYDEATNAAEVEARLLREESPHEDADRVLRAVYVWCAMAAAYESGLYSDTDPDNPHGPYPGR